MEGLMTKERAYVLYVNGFNEGRKQKKQFAACQGDGAYTVAVEQDKLSTEQVFKDVYDLISFLVTDTSDLKCDPLTLGYVTGRIKRLQAFQKDWKPKNKKTRKANPTVEKTRNDVAEETADKLWGKNRSK